MQKVEFSDREEFPKFFPPPLPTTQDQGGAAKFHRRACRSYRSREIPFDFSYGFVEAAADRSAGA
ncbi:hypothetical protein A0128_16995 [Leptospira tipperaryensis]|uniref:Uncharacterized protein n=1 Tax=Leptospira tipperaryensis TaxID=2564040 RepID=A0A1D7V0P2_9LEPT|nr:hypothetical protein A0128_16995 [Leptospira tipperaryensis]